MKILFLLLIPLFSFSQNDICSGINPAYPSPGYCQYFAPQDSVQFCYSWVATQPDFTINPYILANCPANLIILLYDSACNLIDTGIIGDNAVNVGQSYHVCLQYWCDEPGFFQGICYFAGLPISLLYFDARKVDDIVRLGWATASETNNDYFAVERSTNGKGFHQLGIVDGAGNSTDTRVYSYTDFIPYSENYYRLSQHDYDGKIQLSEIRYVKMTDDCIQVFDIFGRNLYIGSKKNFHPPSGIYIVFENGVYKKYLKS